MADKAKLAIAVLLVGSAIGAFYYLGDQALWMRVLVLLGLVIASLAVVAQAEVGRTALGFMKEANIEVRKVVWPTRKEATQTTLIVLAMVVFASLMLWLLDFFLLAAVKWLTGQEG